MQKLSVTIVGLDLVDIVLSLAKSTGLTANPVNQVNKGRLGNFKTLTYIFDIDDDQLIAKRREFMNMLEEEKRFLVPLYEHGDWKNVYIFGRWAFQDE